jgi:glutaredoxin
MSTQAPIEIALYERPGCCLCAEMRAVIEGLGDEMSFRLHCIDISTDPALEARFGTEVPVLFVDGRKAFKYRVTPAALRIRLRRAGAPRR